MAEPLCSEQVPWPEQVTPAQLGFDPASAAPPVAPVPAPFAPLPELPAEAPEPPLLTEPSGPATPPASSSEQATPVSSSGSASQPLRMSMTGVYPAPAGSHPHFLNKPLPAVHTPEQQSLAKEQLLPVAKQHLPLLQLAVARPPAGQQSLLAEQT